MISNPQMLSLPSQHLLLVSSSSSSDHHATLDHLVSSADDSHSTSLLYNLSVLKEKLHQIQSAVVDIVVGSDQNLPPPSSSAVALAAVNSLIQELIMAASSMLLTCQQMNLVVKPSDELHGQLRQGLADDSHGATLFDLVDDSQNWYDMAEVYNNNSSNGSRIEDAAVATAATTTMQGRRLSFDIVELDASDLLARYTHYCRVCGKGFKRDANLRMHMRAHGDEYKASGALSNPEKSHGRDQLKLRKTGTKYSCPQDGCRWNQRHVKFQPLKSLICVKNHYKRTHCPKMYVCKLCSRKKFSVLSDLRTHEKHCGDVKWLCSCGTTFSRKDKLMGHVTLFVGHAPAIGSSANFPGKL